MALQEVWQTPATLVDAEALSARFTYDGVVSRFRPLSGSEPLKADLSFHKLPELMFCGNSYPNGAFAEVNGDGQRAVFVIPISGNARVRWGSQALYSSSTVGLAGDNALLEKVELFPQRRHRMFTLDKSILVKALASYTGQPILDQLIFQSEIDMRDGPGATLAGFADLFHDGFTASQSLGQSPLAVSALTDALIAFIITVLPHNLLHLNNAKNPSGANWQLRRAIDYMTAHAGMPMKMEDVAIVCNMSVRVLYRLFEEQLATTPRRFLRQIRLKAAHQDIADPDNRNTVRQIARRWGFINMGDFAAQHNKAYGALPSFFRKNKHL